MILMRHTGKPADAEWSTTESVPTISCGEPVGSSGALPCDTKFSYRFKTLSKFLRTIIIRPIRRLEISSVVSCYRAIRKESRRSCPPAGWVLADGRLNSQQSSMQMQFKSRIRYGHTMLFANPPNTRSISCHIEFSRRHRVRLHVHISGSRRVVTHETLGF